jgi:hypothetical protein
MKPDQGKTEPPCPDTRRAALAIALSNPRAPLAFEEHSDEELLPLIQSRVQGASREECLLALATVRRLCNAVFDHCNEFRAGRFGSGSAASARAVSHLSRSQPGFSRHEYEEIFAAGMLWTAF